MSGIVYWKETCSNCGRVSEESGEKSDRPRKWDNLLCRTCQRRVDAAATIKYLGTAEEALQSLIDHHGLEAMAVAWLKLERKRGEWGH